jgi:lipoic acid synthetase
VLTPDFRGRRFAIEIVCSAHPDVFNHNTETVPRLYRTVRPQAKYVRSIDFLRKSLQPSTPNLASCSASVKPRTK